MSYPWRIIAAMQVRAKDAKPGEWYPIEPVKSYPFPEGLREGDLVTVVAHDHGSYIVHDRGGQEFRLFRGCVETGFLYEVGNRWLEPDHALVVAEKEKEKRAEEKFRKWNEMKLELRELEERLESLDRGEGISIAGRTREIYGMNRRRMMEWLKDHGFKAVFVFQRQRIEARKGGVV